MAKKNTAIARSPDGFGVFKDPETDWVFKRTLEQMSEKAAEIGDCLYVAQQIDESDIESWITEWTKLAARVERQAQASLAGGHLVSAREGFLRASNYYRTAEYGTPPSHPRHFELWDKSRQTFHQACPLFDPPIQPIEIAFEGFTLPGYFWQAAHAQHSGQGDQTCPTMIAVGGNDSSGEEIVIDIGLATVRRGYNFFTFEYPGHRGAVHLDNRCIKRPNYEVPFKVALDTLEKLPGVDERIALSGYSFGGYVVSRVACHEPRLQAVIPDSPIIDLYEVAAGFWGPIINNIPKGLVNKVVRQRLKTSPMKHALHDYSMWTWGMAGQVMPEWIGSGQPETYNVRADLGKITCPALALVSEDEGPIMVRQAHEFYEGISSTVKKLHVFTLEKDGSNDHCQLDNFARAHQVAFDWLDEVFEYRAEAQHMLTAMQ